MPETIKLTQVPVGTPISMPKNAANAASAAVDGRNDAVKADNNAKSGGFNTKKTGNGADGTTAKAESDDFCRFGWHRQDIIAMVRKRGTTLDALSREHGYSRNYFSLSLTKCRPRIHAIIAHVIGVRLHVIWPQFYDGSDAPRWQMPCDARFHASNSPVDMGVGQ
jgi:Ner family transcriptional regulator